MRAMAAQPYQTRATRAELPEQRRAARRRQTRMRFVLALLVLVGCSHDMRVSFPAPPGAPTGTLVLLMGEPASDVAVSVNGLLMLEGAHTQRIRIDDVPVGTADVVIAANGVDKQIHIWVGDEHPTTVPLGVPDSSAGFVKTLLGTLLTIVVYSLLHH
jgi:hypothetical protein